MQDLFARIAATNDLSPEAAGEAVGHILAFMQVESDDPSAVGEVIEKTPGAPQAVARVEGFEPGAGIMALGGKLMGLGLDLSQIRSVAGEFVEFAKDHAGRDVTDRAIASVPAFAQFV